MKTTVIIVAAGSGLRMGADRPKVFLPLAGRPILCWSVNAFLDHPRIDDVVVAVSDVAAGTAALGPAAGRIRLVEGGERRQDSVRIGLQAMRRADIILVHDAARPLVEPPLIDRVIDAAIEFGAAVPAIGIPETVKRRGDGGFVAQTIRRDELALAQTPQGFRYDLLRQAHDEAARAGIRGTDDASLVERLGVPVRLVEGAPHNIKITVPTDMIVAEALLSVGTREWNDHA